LQTDILGATGVQQSCSTALTSLRFVHGTSTHGYCRVMETTNSLSLKRTALGNRVPLVARSRGPVESDSRTGNGAGVEDFDADPVSLNQVSSQKNTSRSEQNGMLAYVMSMSVEPWVNIWFTLAAVVCDSAVIGLKFDDDDDDDAKTEEMCFVMVFAGDLILAAVDMGTNSFHMVVVRADKQGRFQLMDTEKEDVRLGSGSPDLSVITPDAEDRALAALKRFKILAETRNAEMRVVATSAVREARNRQTFVRRVLDSVGLQVEVLAGTEEACLIYQGVLQALPVYDKTVLVVDIGGGSTEFVLGNSGKPIYATSLKLGHIRLSQQFLALGQNKKEELKKEQVSSVQIFVGE
jgi:Ethanolamine utilization protein EutJ (predicted chaperonin)